MSIITPASLSSLFVNLDFRFQQAMTKAMTFYNQIATVVPSTTISNHYPFLDRMPGNLREWIGERQKQAGQVFDYQISNKLYEGTVGIKRTEIEDNQLALAASITDSIGYQTAIWPDKLITTAIESGTTLLGYDGQPFFNASHPLGDGSATVQSNLFNTANGGAKPLTAANYGSVLTSWRSLKGADGNPLGLGMRPTLMVPTALEFTARTILNAEFIAPTVGVGGNAGSVQSTNIFRNSADLLVNPWLTSATSWYLLDVGGPVRPFIFQSRTAPEFTWLNQQDSDNTFWRDEYVYGVRVRGNAGYGLWFYAVKADV